MDSGFRGVYKYQITNTTIKGEIFIKSLFFPAIFYKTIHRKAKNKDGNDATNYRIMQVI